MADSMYTASSSHPPPPPGPAISQMAPQPPPSRFLRALGQPQTAPQVPEAMPTESASPEKQEVVSASPAPSRFMRALGKEARLRQEERLDDKDKENHSMVHATPSSPSSPSKLPEDKQAVPKKATTPVKKVTVIPEVQALVDSLEDTEACQAACCALEAASVRSSAMHQHVLASGGMEALLTAMQKFREQATIQLAACQTLQHLAASASCSGAARIADAGGCEAILASMCEPHAQDPLIVQAAAHALELLAFGSPASREKVVNAGTIEALLSALKAHRKNPDVQQAIVASLQTVMERNPDCQQIERFAAANGMQNIVACLSEHRNDKQVMYWGRLLLHDICTENRDLKTEALRKLHYQGLELEL